MACQRTGFTFLALFLAVGGCGERARGPELTLEAFLHAAAAVDSSGVADLAVVDEWPLVQGWTLRRISDANVFLRVTPTALTDSVGVLHAQTLVLADQLRNKQRTLDELDDWSKRVEEKQKEFESAQAAHERARQRIRGSSDVGTALDKAVEADRAKQEIAWELEQMFLEYDENVAVLDELKVTLPETESELLRRAAEYETLRRLQKASELSLKNKTGCAESIVLRNVLAIVDVSYATELGLSGNRKCEIELVSAGCDQERGDWVVSNIRYLGTQ